MTDSKKTKTSRLSFVGSDAHYEDARYYDQAYRLRRQDVRFYVDLARRYGGPVLELGAGTGRVALAMAQAGIDVVAVDSMEPMLRRAAERLQRLPKKTRARVQLHQEDLMSLRLETRFPLVIAPFNVWMHLYTRAQIERGFETVRLHLSEDGHFAFDVLLPAPASLARDPSRGYKGGLIRHPRDGERYVYREYFDYDHRTQVQTVRMEFEHPTDRRRSFSTPLTQRQFFPQELQALLHYNGFVIEALWGDFEGEPLSGYAESQVLLTRVAERRSST